MDRPSEGWRGERGDVQHVNTRDAARTSVSVELLGRPRLAPSYPEARMVCQVNLLNRGAHHWQRGRNVAGGMQRKVVMISKKSLWWERKSPSGRMKPSCGWIYRRDVTLIHRSLEAQYHRQAGDSFGWPFFLVAGRSRRPSEIPRVWCPPR